MIGSAEPRPKILVCGGGSIGRRHIANLLSLNAEVFVWRAQTDRLKDLENEFHIKGMRDLDEAINASSAVIVATATDQHIAIALQVLRAGKPLFIEKPVSHSQDRIDDLIRLAGSQTVEVGCQFRVHPNLIALSHIVHDMGDENLLSYRLAMGHRLDAWRPGSNYAAGYSADATRGGGALFDLIHQIDIALWFFGPVVHVSAVLSKRSNLEIAADDMTNLLLTHKNGLTGHIQLDMASPVYRCEAEILTKTAMFTWSYPLGTVTQHDAAEVSIKHRVDSSFERNDLFIKHMQHFLKRITNPELSAICPLTDGIAALQVALSARKSFETGKRIEL